MFCLFDSLLNDFATDLFDPFRSQIFGRTDRVLGLGLCQNCIYQKADPFRKAALSRVTESFDLFQRQQSVGDIKDAIDQGQMGVGFPEESPFDFLGGLSQAFGGIF